MRICSSIALLPLRLSSLHKPTWSFISSHIACIHRDYSPEESAYGAVFLIYRSFRLKKGVRGGKGIPSFLQNFQFNFFSLRWNFSFLFLFIFPFFLSLCVQDCGIEKYVRRVLRQLQILPSTYSCKTFTPIPHFSSMWMTRLVSGFYGSVFGK